MRGLAITLAVLAAGCPAKKRRVATGGGGGGGDADGGRGRPALVMEAIASWGTEPIGRRDDDRPRTRIWLAITDETGAARSYPVGDVDAGCASEVGGEMGALGSLRCPGAPGGANYIVVARQGELIVLRQRLGDPADEPADYEEQTRVAIPEGARVSFAP
jgi:hypothetical protein